MNLRHREEIARAVDLAQRAAASGRLNEEQRLTRFLYRCWYLGQRPSPPASLPAPRARSRLRTAEQPWRAWGARWPTRTARGADLVRLHLSCAPRTSLHALVAVAETARSWDHPWLLTSRAPLQPLPQPDATVLYLPASALSELHDPLRQLVEELKPFLATNVPALTLKVGRGATLAQNPVDGRSYGEHRCSLIAHAVLTGLTRAGSAPGHHELVGRTLETFTAAQVDPERPYRALDAAWEWERARTAA